MRGEVAKLCLYVVARSQRVARMRARWQAPRRSNLLLLSCCFMDCFASLVMTAHGCLKIESVKRGRQSGVALARAAALHRGLEFLAELGEFVGGEIADRPVVQAPV